MNVFVTTDDFELTACMGLLKIALESAVNSSDSEDQYTSGSGATDDGSNDDPLQLYVSSNDNDDNNDSGDNDGDGPGDRELNSDARGGSGCVRGGDVDCSSDVMITTDSVDEDQDTAADINDNVQTPITYQLKTRGLISRNWNFFHG